MHMDLHDDSLLLETPLLMEKSRDHVGPLASFMGPVTADNSA
ncbi:hypothetical protein [Shinella kummerowiae]|nr:hypothetical protein [Shinella kummerowiae]MCT7667434.1 hypothetical protein [Shinella kummerowiae]